MENADKKSEFQTEATINKLMGIDGLVAEYQRDFNNPIPNFKSKNIEESYSKRDIILQIVIHLSLYGLCALALYLLTIWG